MRRETVEQILADRQLQAKDGAFNLVDDEVASLIIGRDSLTAISGVIELRLHQDYLQALSRKSTTTYVEYELVRALAFESKELADRQAGFF